MVVFYGFYQIEISQFALTDPVSGGPCPYAMISDYEAHKLFLMFDLLQTNGQTRKSIYLLQVDLICPGSSLRHKTLIEKGIERPQQRRPFMIC